MLTLRQGLVRRYRHRKAIRNVYRPLMQDWRALLNLHGGTHERCSFARRWKEQLLRDYQRCRERGCKNPGTHTKELRALRGN